jgi:two-component system phosphate regulon sensor histidine kinase PhoR
MKKPFITGLIFMISFALLGLVGIQIYWIKNSIALRDAQFRRNVKIALSEFNHILEKEEAAERVKKHRIGTKLLRSIDSLRVVRPNSGIVLTAEDLGIDSSIYLSAGGEYAFRFKASAHSTRFVDSEIVAGNEAFEKSNLWNAPNTLTQSQSELIVELLSGMLSLDVNNNFLTRYTHGYLDSLLKQCFDEVGGISAVYHFGVFDVFDQPEMISTTAAQYVVPIIEYGYKARLFPSDMLQDPHYVRVWFPSQDTYLLKTLWPLLLSSTAFMLIIILAFGYTIKTILRQKKVSEIKNDFINNMTHELKTPISTISLACEALSDPVMSASKTRVDHFVKMIRDENKRLGVLVENVLRSAVLDRGEMKLNRDNVNLHDIIKAAIHNIQLQASQKDGTIQTNLEAAQAVIKGDKVHLTNVVYNLLDNAIKYTIGRPEILVSTYSSNSSITISVADNGIGIKKEDHERIFEKLFRVHTGDVHNIKGFGLGLSYVKMIVEKHHGTISVKSEPGKGSTFTIKIPYDYEL